MIMLIQCISDKVRLYSTPSSLVSCVHVIRSALLDNLSTARA